MKKLIIASTSTVYKGSYLGYLQQELEILFRDAQEVLFIPYARPGGISHENYTKIAAKHSIALVKICGGYTPLKTLHRL